MKLWNGLSLGLLVAVLITIGFAFDEYGISWDEFFHYEYGDQKLQYYEELWDAEDKWAHVNSAAHDNYPGFFDMTLAMARRLELFGAISTSHLLCALFGVLGMIAVWKIGHHLGGPRLAFLCAFLLIFMPRYYGHMWFNVKDTPFAATFAWSLYFLIRMVEQFPKPGWGRIAAAGVLTGIALGVRSAALLLPCYLGVAMGGDWLRAACAKESPKALAARAGRHAATLFVYGFIALLAVLPWWPYLHANPLWRPIEITMGLQNFFWDGLILFDGEFYRPGTIPRSYLPTWFVITTPLVILLLLAIGAGPLVRACLDRVKGRLQGMTNRDLAVGLVLLAFLFPLVYVVITRPRIYDGLRQFLFILPPAAILAALSLDWLVERLGKPVQRYLVLGGSLFILMAGSLMSYISLHPYEYIYFNSIVGGLPGAFNRYETEYYGISFREAMEKLQQNGHRNPQKEINTVNGSAATWHIIPYLQPGYQLVNDLGQADYYVSYLRGNRHLTAPGYIVEVVEREGVPLNLVIQRWYDPSLPPPSMLVPPTSHGEIIEPNPDTSYFTDSPNAPSTTP